MPKTDTNQLYEQLLIPDSATKLDAMQKIRREKINDPSILSALEAIYNDDSNPSLQKFAQDTLAELGVEAEPTADDFFEITAKTSDREILEKTLQALEVQQRWINQIHYKIGCIYQAMFVAIIIFILQIILSILV